MYFLSVWTRSQLISIGRLTHFVYYPVYILTLFIVVWCRYSHLLYISGVHDGCPLRLRPAHHRCCLRPCVRLLRLSMGQAACREPGEVESGKYLLAVCKNISLLGTSAWCGGARSWGCWRAVSGWRPGDDGDDDGDDDDAADDDVDADNDDDADDDDFLFC